MIELVDSECLSCGKLGFLALRDRYQCKHCENSFMTADQMNILRGWNDYGQADQEASKGHWKDCEGRS